jgi:NAD(P)-dependent dehydrogenase (short-subunit alcohol dehydrogenase family)
MKHVALITGAASGLGKATAELLQTQGYHIVSLDLPCDVTQTKDVESAVAKVMKEYGNIRVCVNCAGINAGERIIGFEAPMALEHFKRIIDVNLIGTFNVMRCVSFAMRNLEPINEEGERGVIINTASIAAFEGQLGQVAYSASKGGVASMTLPAAREFADFGIRIVCIAPGLFQTPMLEQLPEAAQEKLKQETLFPKRLGQAKEYAQCVLDIIQNPMYNGCTIRLDGGVRLNRGK